MRADIAIRHNGAVNAAQMEALARHADETRVMGDRIHDLLAEPQEFHPDYTAPTVGAELVEAIYRAAWDNIAESKEDINKSIEPFFNGRLLPITGVELPEVIEGTAALDINSGYADACSSAEHYFLNLLRQIRTGRYGKQPVVQVYHDEYGQALAARKTHREDSAIMLQPVNADGLVVPAGTIVSIGERADRYQTGRRDRTNYEASTYLVDGSFPIFPWRLSPWSYPRPIDRSGFALNFLRHASNPYVQYNLQLGRRLEQTSIEDFREAANKVLAACGVDSRQERLPGLA